MAGSERLADGDYIVFGRLYPAGKLLEEVHRFLLADNFQPSFHEEIQGLQFCRRSWNIFPLAPLPPMKALERSKMRLAAIEELYRQPTSSERTRERPWNLVRAARAIVRVRKAHLDRIN